MSLLRKLFQTEVSHSEKVANLHTRRLNTLESFYTVRDNLIGLNCEIEDELTEIETEMKLLKESVEVLSTTHEANDRTILKINQIL